MHNWAFLYAFSAGILDVGANLASAQSQGFTKRTWGVISILLVFGAFALLAQACRTLELPVAYAILGATGIFGTAICGRVLFQQRLKPISWLGFAMVLVAIFVLHKASRTDKTPLNTPSQLNTQIQAFRL
jgi:spermidine export protein MdtI